MVGWLDGCWLPGWLYVIKRGFVCVVNESLHMRSEFATAFQYLTLTGELLASASDPKGVMWDHKSMPDGTTVAEKLALFIRAHENCVHGSGFEASFQGQFMTLDAEVVGLLRDVLKVFVASVGAFTFEMMRSMFLRDTMVPILNTRLGIASIHESVMRDTPDAQCV